MAGMEKVTEISAPEMGAPDASVSFTRKVLLPFDHLGRGNPIGPFRLSRYRLHTRPGEAFASDPDRVADRPAAAENVIEVPARRVDHESSRRFSRRIGDQLATKLRRQYAFVLPIDGGLIAQDLIEDRRGRPAWIDHREWRA